MSYSQKTSLTKGEINSKSCTIIENRSVKKIKQRLTVKELAEYLEVSEKTIYGWVYRRLIPFDKIGPRLVRFDVATVEQWISSQPRGNL